MAPSLYVTRIGLTVKGRLPRYALEKYIPASLDTLGQQLAQQVDDYTRQNQLGYYPALDFFKLQQKQQGSVDSYLLDAADDVAQIAMTITKQEATRILAPVFSSVRIESVLSLAYALPSVRPGQKNALERLALHYIPDVVKFECFITMLQRHEAKPGIEIGAKKIAWQWLREAFEEMEITTARLIAG